MSSSLHVYVGPYFRCISPLVETDVVIHNSCSRRICKRYKREQDGKFCSECGNKLETFHDKIMGPKVTFHAVREALPREDSLNNLMNPNGPISRSLEGEVHIWVGEKFFHRSYDLQLSTSSETQLADDTIQKERDNLLSALREEFCVLVELYGEANVSCVWGIINYYW